MDSYKTLMPVKRDGKRHPTGSVLAFKDSEVDALIESGVIPDEPVDPMIAGIGELHLDDLLETLVEAGDDLSAMNMGEVHQALEGLQEGASKGVTRKMVDDYLAGVEGD